MSRLRLQGADGGIRAKLGARLAHFGAFVYNRSRAQQCVGWDLFHESIEPELRVVRIGRRKLIPVSELQAWLDRKAEKVL